MEKKRLIVALSGASGAILGVRFLQALSAYRDWESHLILSKAAETTLVEETGLHPEEASQMADHSYSIENMGAAIASGTYKTEGMVIIPCSMKTAAGICCGYSDNLLLRAADVCLKERRKLVLVARETPLSEVHLRNMYELSKMGAILLPPMLTFYNHPNTIDDMIHHIIGKTLDCFGLELQNFRRWGAC